MAFAGARLIFSLSVISALAKGTARLAGLGRLWPPWEWCNGSLGLSFKICAGGQQGRWMALPAESMRLGMAVDASQSIDI